MCLNIFQDILKNDKLCKFLGLWLVIRIPLVIQEEFTSITMYVITICNITYAYGGRSEKHKFHLFQKYTARKKRRAYIAKQLMSKHVPGFITTSLFFLFVQIDFIKKVMVVQRITREYDLNKLNLKKC